MDANKINYAKQLIGGVVLAMSELEFLVFRIIYAKNRGLVPDNYINFKKLTNALESILRVNGIKGNIVRPLIIDLGNLNKDRHKFAHQILLENPTQYPGKLFLSKDRKNSGWFKILNGDEIEKEYETFIKRCGILSATLVLIAREDLKLSI